MESNERIMKSNERIIKLLLEMRSEQQEAARKASTRYAWTIVLLCVLMFPLLQMLRRALIYYF